MAFVGLFSGKRIKEDTKKQKQLTRTQTASHAKGAIIEKYGKIVDSGRYYYAGKNRGWVRYSKSRDAQRTGNVTSDKNKWKASPHKYDFPNVDTEGGTNSKGPYFGKDFTKGKYSPNINMKRSVISILKNHYPKTQFIVVAGWGVRNIGIFWAGGPSVKEVRDLDIGRGADNRRGSIIGFELRLNKVSIKDYPETLYRFLGTKDKRTFYKASPTIPVRSIEKPPERKYPDHSRFVNLLRRKIKSCKIYQDGHKLKVECRDVQKCKKMVIKYLKNDGYPAYVDRSGEVDVEGGPFIVFKKK